MAVFLGWIVFSGLAGWIAAQKGRSGIGIFFLALFLSPLVGIIVALVLKRHEPLDTKPEPIGRSCPFCAETIKFEAIVCKHCGRDVPKHGPEASVSAEALDKLVASGQFRQK